MGTKFLTGVVEFDGLLSRLLELDRSEIDL